MADTTDHARSGMGKGCPSPSAMALWGLPGGPPWFYLVGSVVGATAAAFGYRWLVLDRSDAAGPYDSSRTNSRPAARDSRSACTEPSRTPEQAPQTQLFKVAA